MKLWKLTQKDPVKLRDKFTAIVVSAETEEDAKAMHPYHEWPKNSYMIGSGTWADTPDGVDALYLGEAAEGMGSERICEAFWGS